MMMIRRRRSKTKTALLPWINFKRSSKAPRRRRRRRRRRRAARVCVRAIDYYCDAFFFHIAFFERSATKTIVKLYMNFSTTT